MFQLGLPPKPYFMMKVVLLILDLTANIMVTLTCDKNIILTGIYDSLFETDLI